MRLSSAIRVGFVGFMLARIVALGQSNPSALSTNRLCL